MKKAKRYQEGGITINQPAPAQPLPSLAGYDASSSTYPFQSTSAASPDSGVNQTFNIQPSAQAGEPLQMKRGGKIKSASKRADGCAIRGKTRA